MQIELTDELLAALIAEYIARQAANETAHLDN